MVDWGLIGDAHNHRRYSTKVEGRSRRRCFCGCNMRATHTGMANGVALIHACEFAIARWVKTGSLRCVVNKEKPHD